MRFLYVMTTIMYYKAKWVSCVFAPKSNTVLAIRDGELLTVVVPRHDATAGEGGLNFHYKCERGRYVNGLPPRLSHTPLNS